MKQLLLMLLIAIKIKALPQTNNLANGIESFENWFGMEAGNLPVDWDGFNREIVMNGSSVGTVTTVYKDSVNPYDSNYSVKLVSSSIMGGPAVPGMLTTGNLVINFQTQNGDIEGGVPFTDRPLRLKGYFKYSPANNDTASITCWFKKDGNEIGGGEFLISNTVNQWTEFTVDIYFSEPVLPDTMNVLFSTSKSRNNVPAGSVLEIDKVSFEGSSVEIEDIVSGDNFGVYPNPAKDFLNLKFHTEKNRQVYIYNSNGSLVYSENISTSSKRINTCDWQSGVYFIKLVSDKTKITQKIVVQ